MLKTEVVRDLLSYLKNKEIDINTILGHTHPDVPKCAEFLLYYAWIVKNDLQFQQLVDDSKCFFRIETDILKSKQRKK